MRETYPKKLKKIKALQQGKRECGQPQLSKIKNETVREDRMMKMVKK